MDISRGYFIEEITGSFRVIQHYDGLVGIDHWHREMAGYKTREAAVAAAEEYLATPRPSHAQKERVWHRVKEILAPAQSAFDAEHALYRASGYSTTPPLPISWEQKDAAWDQALSELSGRA